MADPKHSSTIVARQPNSHASKPAKANKIPLSAELVGDSDEGDEEERSEPKKKDAKHKKSTATASKPITTEFASWGQKQSEKRKYQSPAPIRSVANGSGAVNNNHDDSTGEDDRSGGSSSHDPSPILVRSTTLAPVRAGNAKPLKPAVIKDTAPNNNAGHSEKHQVLESTSEEGSESGSASGSEDESKDESASSDETSIQSPAKCTPTDTSAFQPVLLPYAPPPGFEPALVSSHPSSKIPEIFASSNLDGKEIWHITVPSSVPVTAIKEVSAQSLQSGRPILSHEGAVYGLVPTSEAEANNRALLLPSSPTNDYQPSRIPILRTLHLQRFVQLPIRAQQNAGIPYPTAKQRTHVKEVRQQPQGLKMRYHAFGTSDQSDSDVSTITAFKAPEFRIPDVSSRPVKKRKLSTNIAENTQVFTTEFKKRKTHHEIPIQTDVSAMDTDDPMKATSQERRRSSVASPVNVRATAVTGSESRREKTRIKDGKRHKDKNTPTASQSILPTDLTKEAETIMPEEVVNNDAGINRLPPEMDPRAAKAQSKEEKRKRREMKKAIPAKTEQLPLAEQAAPIQQGSRRQSIELSTNLQPSKHSSPRRTTATKNDNQATPPISVQSTPYKETKEEKAERKKKQKMRNVASDLCDTPTTDVLLLQ